MTPFCLMTLSAKARHRGTAYEVNTRATPAAISAFDIPELIYGSLTNHIGVSSASRNLTR